LVVLCEFNSHTSELTVTTGQLLTCIAICIRFKTSYKFSFKDKTVLSKGSIVVLFY